MRLLDTRKRGIGALARGARGLAADDRGGVLLLWAFLLIPIVLVVGLAVDVSRAYLVKSRLIFALDAAALAVGSSRGTQAELETVMQRFFDVNYPLDLLGTPATPSLSIQGDVITVAGRAVVGTTFMRLAGFETLTVSELVEITRETRGLELVLVLDNTGSMRGQKIESLRQASHDLIGILFGDDELKDYLKIGIVPYSAAVNVGAEAPELITQVGQGDYDPSNDEKWKGCVTARDYPHDVRDSSMIGNNKWSRYLWEAAPDNLWPPVDTSPDLCNDSTGPNLACPTPITPLTNLRATLVDDIDAMEAWCRGGTFSNIGMVWGWRVLSPDGPFDQGLPYGTPGYDKAAVLMTDGVNGYYRPPGSPFDSDYSAYGRVEEGRLGTTNRGAAKTALNNRLVEVCDNMKAEGILIYTITFALNDSNTKQIYEACASDPTKYFDSPDAADLREVFQEIANQLRSLRITR